MCRPDPGKSAPCLFLQRPHTLAESPETSCAWPPLDPGHVTACRPPPAPRPLPRPLPCPLPGHSCRGCRPQLPREPPGGSPALACPSHRLGRPSVAGDRPSRLCSACHLTPETQLARHRHAQPLIYETARSPRSIHGHRGPSSEGAGMRRSTHSSFTPLPKSRWLNSCLPFSHKPGNGSERLPVTWLHP